MSSELTKQELFKLKIKAFLHDPPEKPLILGLGDGHEASSRAYIKALLGEEETFQKDEWKFADHVASAADRTSFPMDITKFQVNFRKNPIITHPTSGTNYRLGDFSKIDAKDIKESVLKACNEIREKANGNYEKMYLYLWRYFPEIVTKHESNNSKIGLLWKYLPADTRIPDHSVLDHAKMVSAFAAAEIKANSVNASLILFTIGPVQEFIAAARKTSDLWAGSYMLSWLSWQAMKVFVEAFGPDCILFPDLSGQPLVDYWLKFEKELDVNFDTVLLKKELNAPTLPNRFFAIAPGVQIKEVAKKAENAVKEELLKIGSFTYTKLKEENIFPENAPDFSVWENQINNFSESYWATFKLPNWKMGTNDIGKLFDEQFEDLFIFIDDEKGGNKRNYRNDIYNAYKEGGFNPNLGTFYGRFYEILEKAVGARKAIRDFKPLIESGYRCSLIPNLATLTPKDSEHITPKEYGDFWVELFEKAIISNLDSKLGKNERLSPLAFTKRYFPDYLEKVAFSKIKFDAKNFVSTHSLAVADFKYEIIKKIVDGDNEVVETAKDFVEMASKLIAKLNLQPDTPLSKLRWLGEQASLDSKIAAMNICTLPGELLQLDYYDGSYKSDLKNQNDHQIGLVNETKYCLKDLIKAAKIGHPAKYYALLYLDGDNMGQWLSGDNAPDFHKVLHPEAVRDLINGSEDQEYRKHDYYKGWAKIFKGEAGETLKDANGEIHSLKRPQAPTQHVAISRALNNYSLELVRAIVEEEYLGKLIYAGGDDVVAMLSLNDALPCAEKLRAAFSGHLKSDENKTANSLQSDLKSDLDSNNPEMDKSGYVILKKNNATQIITTLGTAATASCGVAIAHYMYPLKQTMAEARMAEKFAKKELGRDALAINVIKRSGEKFVCGSKWRIKSSDEKTYQLIFSEVLKELGKAFQKGYLSPKFIVDIEELLPILEGLPNDAVITEIKRLYNQHSEGFQDIGKLPNESQKDFRERVSKTKKEFFKSTIGFLLNNQDHFGDFKKKNDNSNTSSIESKSLNNIIQLMDMILYISKGGGR